MGRLPDGQEGVRPTVSISQITLTNYDTVVTVTQNAVNETLAEYLYALEKNVALYYNVDENGNYIPAPDPSTAYYTFTGTLDYAVDQNGNPVDIVVLNTNMAQTVIYNITFKNAEFKSSIPPMFDIKQVSGGEPWVIQFEVNLTTTEVSLSVLPTSTQTTIQNATQGLGPNAFSIQQLYLDLNTANYDTYQSITGMSSFAESIMAGIMKAYLASLQQSGGVIFGYAVQATGSSNPPTFLPTALEFCVTPYTDQNGQHSVPGLDTLNYLVMTNYVPLPPQVPTGFGFNWVTDPTIQGAMAVRSDLYISFLLTQLNPILNTISPVCYVKADVNQGIDAQTMQLNAGSGGQSFSPVSPPQNGLVANYSYTAAPASDQQMGFGGGVSVSLSYSSTCAVTFSGPTITLSGTSVVTADSQQSDEFGNVIDHSMPPTTYSWSVDLLLEMDPNNAGQLNFLMQNPNFDTAPTVAPVHQSAWDKFWDAVGGVFQSFAKDPGDIRETVNTQVVGNIQPAISSAIKTANAFVFPGGATFLFENPGFTNTDDLAANITYNAPSTKAEAVGAGA